MIEVLLFNNDLDVLKWLLFSCLFTSVI